MAGAFSKRGIFHESPRISRNFSDSSPFVRFVENDLNRLCYLAGLPPKKNAPEMAKISVEDEHTKQHV